MSLTNKEQIQSYFEACKRIGLFRERLIEVKWLPDDQGIVINGTRCPTLREVMDAVGKTAGVSRQS